MTTKLNIIHSSNSHLKKLLVVI